MDTPIVLSKLQPGRLYRITADAVDAILQIIEAGAFPTCLISGDLRNLIRSEDDETSEIAHIQLVGWATTGRDMRTPTGFRLFHEDIQPEGAWLLGIRVGADFCPEVMLLALDPTITMITDASQDAAQA